MPFNAPLNRIRRNTAGLSSRPASAAAAFRITHG